MGQRRVKCLKQLGHEVTGWDIIHKTEMPREKYDGIFISTPPDKHEQYMCNLGHPTFVEASVIPYKCYSNVYPSCTMRFHPRVLDIKEQITHHKPLAFHYHIGNLITDWHPTKNLKDCYFSSKEMGGCREIVAFENEWLQWLFGKAEVIGAYHGKLSNLDMQADDYYTYILKFASGVIGNITIDVISRPKCREFKLIYAGETKYYDLQNIEDWEDIYLQETKAFVDAIQRKRAWGYSVNDDLQNLEMLEEIEKK